MALTPRAPPASPFLPLPRAVFHWLNADHSLEFSYDIGSLCTPNDRTFYVPFDAPNQARGWTMKYAIAGNVSSFRCNPVWQPTYFSGGSFIESWDLDKPRPNGTTVDPETGLLTPISYPCEVLANKRPEFDLIDESNPATGGIALSYTAMPEPSSDNNKCPFSKFWNGPGPRQLTINLHCDPSVADLYADPDTAWAEASPCTYTFNVTTKAACGIPGDPFTAPVAAASRSGTNFGYTVLGSFLTLGIGAAFVMADARGWLDAIKSRLPSSMRGGSSAGSYSSVFTTTQPSTSGFAATRGGAYGSA